MREYTSDAPVYSDKIRIVEENDLINSENNNAAVIQLLQNILVLQSIKVDKEDGRGLISEAERKIWNAIYEQATGYTDQKIADLINSAPSTLDTLGEIADAMSKNEDIVVALNEAIGTKANKIEMESLLGTKLDKAGDSLNNTVTFSSNDTLTPSTWSDYNVIQSGETHKSILEKISTVFKNVRYLWKLLGNTNINNIGDGTVTGSINLLKKGYDDLGTASKEDSTGTPTSVVHTDFNNNKDDLISKGFLSYWNGAYDSKNTSNLRYSANGEIIGSENINKQSVKYAESSGSANSVAWGNISGKPDTYSPSNHIHDDRYYTVNEVNNMCKSVVCVSTGTAVTQSIDAKSNADISFTTPTGIGYNYYLLNVYTNTKQNVSVKAIGKTGIRVHNNTDSAQSVTFTPYWLEIRSSY